MYNEWRDKSDHGVTIKKGSYCQQGMVRWPTGVLGWIRIPTLVVGIAGSLGILKNVSPAAARLLKPLNLPSIEFCWIMLAVTAVVYLLCVVCWLWPKITPDITPEIYDQPNKKASASPGRWRSL